MSRFIHRWSWRRGRWLAAAGILSLGLVLPARAIEMFTYFGDGSRIGLPSLEVPVQAYPGIPLRSDRIRARNRAQQARRAAEATARGGQSADRSSPAGATAAGVQPPGADGYPGIPGGGITIRPMTPAPLQSQPGVPRSRAIGPPSAGNGFPPPPPPTSTPAHVVPARETDWSTLRGGAPAPQGTASPPVQAPRQPQPEVVPLPGFNQPVFPGATGANPPGKPSGR